MRAVKRILFPGNLCLISHIGRYFIPYSWRNHPDSILLSCLFLFISITVCGNSQPVLSAVVNEESEYLFSLPLEELLAVKVTVATGAPQRSIDAPGIISIITDKDIAYWGHQSVAEAINTLPGIYCIDDGLSPNCGMRGINGGFRGYSKVIKVMINGQPVSFRSDSNNYLGPELLPISVVERIEVIRGPVSAVYGANAYLGVVNIITKRAEDRSTGELRLTHDGYGDYLSLNYQRSRSNMNSTLSLSTAALDRSGSQIPEDLPSRSLFISGTTTQEDISRPYSWFGQVDFDFGHHMMEVNTHYSRLDSKANLVDFGRFAEIGELGTNVRFSVENWYIQAKDRWRWRENMKFDFSIAYGEGQPSDVEKLDVGLTNSYPARDFGFEALDLVAEALWDITDLHHLTLGVDYSEDDEKLFEAFDVDRRSGIRTQRAAPQSNKTLYNVGFYVQYIGELSEKAGLTMNVRQDDQNIYGQNSSYRAGAIYKINDSVSTKLLFGTSFKAPAAVQLYGQPLFDGEVTGNVFLKEEKANTLEAQLNCLLTENINWSINVYRMEVDDQVELVLRGANQTPENQAEQESTGVESELLWQGNFNSISANIALQESKAQTLDMLGRTITTPSELYPEYTNDVFWKHSLSPQVNFGLHWKYVSPRRATKSNIQINGGEPYQRDDYHLLNLALHYDFNEVHFNLSVKNILDEVYAEPGFSGVDVPGIPRNVQFIVSLAL